MEIGHKLPAVVFTGYRHRGDISQFNTNTWMRPRPANELDRSKNISLDPRADR